MLAGLGLAGLIGVPGEAVFASERLGRLVLAAGMLLLEKAVLCLGDLRGDGWMLFSGAMAYNALTLRATPLPLQLSSAL